MRDRCTAALVAPVARKTRSHKRWRDSCIGWQSVLNGRRGKAVIERVAVDRHAVA